MHRFCGDFRFDDPAEISVFVQTLEVPRILTLLIILLILFFLGMLMVPIGIYAMTLPIFFPVIVSLKYDPIWFGVICLKMMEIGAVTPPVGLNIYAMKGVVGKDISLEDIFRGVWPFVLCDLVVLGFLILFPEIATWLPNLLFD
jgi:TRAP-type C4-dicarboxylate transport system permease large subunit